jgi:signal transduction histidine kinase
MNSKTYKIFIIVLLTAMTTYLHVAMVQPHFPRVVLDELYYLPLLVGVLCFELRGAIVTWLFVSVAYLPFCFGSWATSFPEVADRLLHLVSTGIFVIVACFLAERIRKNRQQAEQDRYLAGIGQVAAVIVHDLKNPLVSILGFARRIREGKGDSVIGAKTIEDSAHSMQKIVNSVLDFAKPLQLDCNDADLGDCIRQATDLCRIKADTRNVSISLLFPPTSLIAAIDRFHIERALINLIDNAVDASPTGGAIVITLAPRKNILTITIKDQGAGMSPETLANLYMPFYTTKNDGTGLGMPISKKVIEAHGGTLYISSKPGKGTEVVIRLLRSEALVAKGS